MLTLYRSAPEVGPSASAHPVTSMTLCRGGAKRRGKRGYNYEIKGGGQPSPAPEEGVHIRWYGLQWHWGCQMRGLIE